MAKPLPHTTKNPPKARKPWLRRSIAGLFGRAAQLVLEPKPAAKAKPAPKRKPASKARPARVKKDAPIQHQPQAPSRAESALLPPFPGLTPDRIHVPKTLAQCEAAARDILAAGVAGFDTEAKPTFRVGEKSTGPHVVQFALTDQAFIFQLHRRDCLPIVASLIESDRVLKVGFGLRNDHGQIRHRLGVQLNHVLDLDTIFRKRGHRGQIGVRGAIATLLGLSFPKSKATTTSNWAAPDLTPRQLKYAANDAFAALKVMEALDLQPSDLPRRF